MTELIPVGPDDLRRLTAYQSGGLYLLQSASTPTLFRIGETGDLSSRSGKHGSAAPKTRWKKAPNWTELHRPWRFIWALSTPEATELGRKMCEHHLHAAYARHYEFVDISGFEAREDSAPRLIEIADNERHAFVAICERQRRERFDKEAHFRATWENPASLS